VEYVIKYLPIAEKDLIEIVDYISETLKVPRTALNFVNEVEKKILNLKTRPYSHRIYRPSKPIDTEYRILNVKNYLIFYVVLDDIIEIHRVIYNKRDLTKIIE
jgi:plasmid stabilization system protein ParE